MGETGYVLRCVQPTHVLGEFVLAWERRMFHFQGFCELAVKATMKSQLI